MFACGPFAYRLVGCSDVFCVTCLPLLGACGGEWDMVGHDVLHIVLYDLQLNDPFLCLTSVLSQNTGIPIDRPMSAQLASLRLKYREVVPPLPWGLQHTMWVRYRDNFLLMMRRLLGVTWTCYSRAIRRN